MMSSNNQPITPKISVICVTYNQEQYVAQAIESFLAQKTDFPIEIIISDDCSTDSTKSIISSYAKKHSNIRAYYNQENLGVAGNFYKAIRLSRGKYMAMCEGDDFWVDDTKLQQQADFFDQHPTYSVCFHPVNIMIDEKMSGEIYPGSGSNRFTINNLLKQNFIQTNSVMYRRQDSYPGIDSSALPVDWYLHLYHAKQGKIGFINKPMAVYRRHRGGVWWKDSQSQVDFWQRNAIRHLRFFEAVEQLFIKDQQYLPIIYKSIEEFIDNVCFEVGEQDNYEIANEIVRAFPAYVARTIIHHVSEGPAPQQQIKELKDQLHRLELGHEALEQEKLHLTDQVAQRDKHLHEIINSKSWRLTKPLRDLNSRRHG